MTTVIHLDQRQLEQLADLIADKLAVRNDGELITASDLAERIGRTREWIYDHSSHLGAIRVGDGERPRLLFRWPQALDRLDNATPSNAKAIQTTAVARRRRGKQAHSNLLPIRGQST